MRLAQAGYETSMNLKNSIYHRAKALVEKHERGLLLRNNRLAEDVVLPREILETLETVGNYLPEQATLLDIGAHKGLFAQGANLFFKLRETICFEPNQALHPQIASATSAFNTKVEHLALSDKEGEIQFFLHQDDSMNSTVEADKDLLREEFPWDNPDHLQATRVPTMTLDQYVERNGLGDRRFFIKIDTQGNELDILRHAEKTLAQTAVIVAEFMFLNPYQSSYSFMDLVSFMESHNFSCRGALTIAKRPSKKVSAVDFLFVKQ